MADYTRAARDRINRYREGGRTFGNAFGGSSSARSYGPQQTPSPISIGGGGVNFPLDQEALQEISDIRTQAAIDLAEYQQRVANAGSEAAAQRGQVSRQMGISSDAAARGSAATNNIFNTLMGDYGDIAPRYEADYNAGAEATRRGYQDARQNLAYGMIEGNNREAELAAMAGQSTGPQEQYDAPVGLYDALLGASGSAGSEAMRVMGQAETGYQRAAVPGFGTERDQLVSDINLERDAELSDLRNQLAQIHPAFVPFNGAQMQFDTERAIREAIMGSRERQEGERSTYSGREDVRRFSSERGREDLGRNFLNLVAAAREGVPNAAGEAMPEDQAIMTLINSFGTPAQGSRRVDDTHRPSQEEVSRLRDVAMRASGSRRDAAQRAYYAALDARRTMPKSYGITRSAKLADTNARLEDDRAVLRDLYDIYIGNYSS